MHNSDHKRDKAADVIFVTTLNNKVSFVVGVYYLNKFWGGAIQSFLGYDQESANLCTLCQYMSDA